MAPRLDPGKTVVVVRKDPRKESVEPLDLMLLPARAENACGDASAQGVLPRLYLPRSLSTENPVWSDDAKVFR